MENPNKRFNKFISSPQYRKKVLRKIHRDQDKKYYSDIHKAESVLDKCRKNRSKEIDQIIDERNITKCGGGYIYNPTEGTVTINGKTYLFTDIGDAEVREVDGVRTVSHDNTYQKKHTSVGGGLLGLAIGGPTGALIGGSVLGKTTSHGSITSEQIATCNHLGVYVTLQGVRDEVVFINHQIDLNSGKYERLWDCANQMVADLKVLAKTPVPENFLRPEEEDSVKEIDKQIKAAEIELQKAKDNKPKYELPDAFRDTSKLNMTDAEYLNYLDEQNNLNEEQIWKLHKFHSPDYTISKAFIKAWMLVLSIFSVLNIILIAGVLSKHFVAAGIVFFISLALTNPFIGLWAMRNIKKDIIWISIPIFMMALIIGSLMV